MNSHLANSVKAERIPNVRRRKYVPLPILWLRVHAEDQLLQALWSRPGASRQRPSYGPSLERCAPTPRVTICSGVLIARFALTVVTVPTAGPSKQGGRTCTPSLPRRHSMARGRDFLRCCRAAVDLAIGAPWSRSSADRGERDRWRTAFPSSWDGSSDRPTRPDWAAFRSADSAATTSSMMVRRRIWKKAQAELTAA